MNKAEELQQLKQQLAELQAKIEELEKKDNWEMKCPYEKGQECYWVDSYGETGRYICGENEYLLDIELWEQGNVFPTEEAAELEKKRRNLLTRFRAFRDECNGDWKPDWSDDNESKFYIYSVFEGVEGYELEVLSNFEGSMNEFHIFGYFKNVKGANRAIELFGDEIIELFVEAE